MFTQQTLVTCYHKQALPNYGVFDEKRYFTPGPNVACHFKIGEHLFGLCICEDIWEEGPVERLLEAQITHLICINASPFEFDKYAKRQTLLEKHARRGLTIVYVNQVGGQDALVFDGKSLVLNQEGEVKAREPAFEESFGTVLLRGDNIEGKVAPLFDVNALIYNALVCGLKDYVEKNNFPGVILGLSGGIDSALTLAIAVDANALRPS